MKTSITCSNHGLKKGHKIQFEIEENRWWMLFFYWAIKKPSKMRKVARKIDFVDSNTFTIKPY